MKAAGITLSTVGAGGGSNPFLEQLATQGGGRFYAAANPASIPDIFLKETQQVSGQQIVEEPFFPIQTSSSPILRGLDEGLPQLLGYNGTTAKPAAQTVLVTAARRSAPRPVAVRPRAVRGVDVGLDRPLGQGLARLARLRRGSSASSSSWTFPGEETDGIEATFDDDGRADARCTSRASRPTARRATSTRRTRCVVGPDLEPRDVDARPGRAGRVRGAARRDRPGRVRGPGHPDQAGVVAARADGRARRADVGRVPAARARTSRSWRRCGPRPAAPRSSTADRPVDPRPDGHEPRSPTCGRCCWSWRCCCGRSTSRCGGSRSGGASSPRRAAGSRGLGGRRRRDGAADGDRARACSRRASGRPASAVAGRRCADPATATAEPTATAAPAAPTAAEPPPAADAAQRRAAASATPKPGAGRRAATAAAAAAGSGRARRGRPTRSRASATPSAPAGR